MMKQLCFDKVADVYDDYYQSDLGIKVDQAEKRKMKEILSLIKGRKILEIGCGTGHWTEFLADLGFQVQGVDISEKMLEKARLKNISDAQFSKESVEKLSFDEHSIDNIIAITSLEFVENTDLAFNEIKRVLKPGGYFVLACLNINSPIGKAKAESEMFAPAHFFDAQELNERLSVFGTPHIDGSCIMENGEIVDVEKDFEAKKYRLENACMLFGIVKHDKIC